MVMATFSKLHGISEIGRYQFVTIFPLRILSDERLSGDGIEWKLGRCYEGCKRGGGRGGAKSRYGGQSAASATIDRLSI